MPEPKQRTLYNISLLFPSPPSPSIVDHELAGQSPISISLASDCRQASKPEVCKPETPRRGEPGGPPGPGRKKKQSTKTILEKWNVPGPHGFWNWQKDIEPCILTRSNRYEVWEPTNKQRKAVEQILTIDEQGNFKHSMSLLIEPRRHGKSTVFCLIILWLITSRQNFTTQLLGTQESHTKRVMFNLAKRIIVNTPRLSRMIPENNILLHEISFPPLDSRIQMSPGVSFSGSFGERLNVLWCSDLHASPDLESFNALQASLLDSENSLCLIDSNVDFVDGPVHGLENEAKLDPSIFCDRVEYKDFQDFEKNAPLWIDRPKAKRLEKTSLPTDYARDVLGRRSDAKNALFPQSIINLCKSKYQVPVSDLKELTKGRSYKIGGGLDRSKGLFSGVTSGDATIWSCILKVASPEHGEPEIYILNQEKIVPNTSRTIKKAILKDHERYHLDNVALENYEVADLAPWLTDQKISYELVSAHDTNQNISFPEFFRIAKENRFHFPASLKGLASEMSTFAYSQRPGGKYSFGHSSKRFKDDRIYSVNWSIFSLRDQVLNLYTLGSFACKNKSRKRELCYLMGRGGDLQLLCSQHCYAHSQVEEMFQEYKQLRLDDELTIPEFFQTHVKLTGARISQAA